MTEFAASNPPAVADGVAPSTAPALFREGGDLAASGQPLSRTASAVATAAINQNIIVAHRKNGPGLFVRAIWYLFVGWWLTGLAIGFAWLCALSVVLLPIAYLIVNKLPTLLTLRPRSIETEASIDADGTLRITTGGAKQLPFWQRALWFLVVGWWLCGVAMAVAYVMCLTLILLPFGLMLFNRVPAVMTLQRN